MAHNASVLTRDELRNRRGKHWNHGYRLGLRIAEDEAKPRPAKRSLRASTRRMLADFPPSETTIDLRGLLPSLSDAALWEGACSLAEESAYVAAARGAARDPRLEGRPPPGLDPTLSHAAAADGSVAEWCEQLLEGALDGALLEGCEWRYPNPATHGKTLNISGWENLQLEPLRALSLSLGATRARRTARTS